MQSKLHSYRLGAVIANAIDGRSYFIPAGYARWIVFEEKVSTLRIDLATVVNNQIIGAEIHVDFCSDRNVLQALLPEEAESLISVLAEDSHNAIGKW